MNKQAVGNKIYICVDMHGRYDAVTGQQIAQRYEALNLMWLEEPIPAENVEAYRWVTESTSTPICAGDNHYLVDIVTGFPVACWQQQRDVT